MIGNNSMIVTINYDHNISVIDIVVLIVVYK